MKVLCIDGNWNKGGLPNPSKSPKEGDINNVTDTDIIMGKPVYELMGYPLVWWEQENFMPLSEIDEMELVREKQLEEV